MRPTSSPRSGDGNGREREREKNRFVHVLDFVARRYKVRPSELMDMDIRQYPALALSFDIEVAIAGATAESRAIEEDKRGSSNRQSVGDMETILGSLPAGSVARRRFEEVKQAHGGRHQ